MINSTVSGYLPVPDALPKGNNSLPGQHGATLLVENPIWSRLRRLLRQADDVQGNFIPSVIVLSIRSASDMKQHSTSVKIYFALVAFLILSKLFFLISPVKLPLAGNEIVFSPLTILLLAILGYAGLLLAQKTGFPDIWDKRVTNQQRFLIPCIVGLIYGLVTIAPLLAGASNRLHPLATGSDVHVKLPLSIPYYAYGAVFLEIFLRLFCIPVLVWLISNVILRGKWQTPVFWFAALVVAFYEPMPFMMEDFAGKTSLGSLYVVFITITAPLFISNVVAAYLFRKYGFLAAVVMRLSHYLIWHIIYGGLT